MSGGSPWRRRLRGFAAGYLAVGLAISLVQNLWARAAGEPTAFAWTGSLGGNALLFFWWFLVPALIWPWDLFWAVWHRLSR